MTFETYLPRPPLSKCIPHIVRSVDHRPQRRVEEVLPNGSMQLILDLRDDVSDLAKRDRLRECGGVMLSGIQSQAIALDAASLESVICVPFKAGGPCQFFPRPPGGALLECVDV